MIIELLKPINDKEFNSLKSKKRGSIGEEIQIYTKNLGFPDLDSTDIAIIGISETRNSFFESIHFNVEKLIKIILNFTICT